MLSMPRIVRPNLSGVIRIEIGSPVGPATHRSIKRNKELAEPLVGSFRRQENHHRYLLLLRRKFAGLVISLLSNDTVYMPGIEQPQLRIAMWSGPRNISTAMMRAWGNRPDTVVVDEPFYAFYLKGTGTKHPGAEEVIAQGETDWRKVVELCRRNANPARTLSVATSRKIFYQKQMTHHLLPEVSRDWLREVTNCFLIRDPAEVIASYIKKNPEPELNDLGFVQQAEIFDFVRRQTGSTPPVIDADDVLRDPERMLRLLCDKIGVDFSDAMLSWPPGARDTDGIWAKYWYAEVERSTGFQPYREGKIEVPESLRKIEQRCRQCYEQLYAVRLR
jgi:hypothetical protein